MCHLLLRGASEAKELFETSAKVYVRYAEAEVEKHYSYIKSFEIESLEDYRVAESAAE